MTARPPVKVALTVPLFLLVALVALYLTIQSGALSTSVPHRLDTGPAAAPASAQGTTIKADQSKPGSATIHQSSSSAGAQAPATGASHPSGTIASGGPEDAGHDVVTQRSGSQVCAPKICRPLT